MVPSSRPASSPLDPVITASTAAGEGSDRSTTSTLLPRSFAVVTRWAPRLWARATLASSVSRTARAPKCCSKRRASRYPTAPSPMRLSCLCVVSAFIRQRRKRRAQLSHNTLRLLSSENGCSRKVSTEWGKRESECGKSVENTMQLLPMRLKTSSAMSSSASTPAKHCLVKILTRSQPQLVAHHGFAELMVLVHAP